MKKRTAVLAAIGLILVTAVITAVGSGAGFRRFQRTRIVIDGEVFSRDAQEADFSGRPVTETGKLTELTELKKLDLRDTGLTVEEYEYLRQKLPDCRILWTVPFQNGYLDELTRELTVTELTWEDLERMSYLPELDTVNARECEDYEMIRALMRIYPELTVYYNVEIGGKQYPENTSKLRIINGDMRGLREGLEMLPHMETVTFLGKTPENEQIRELMEQFPHITFVWNFELFGVPVNSLDTRLNLSGIPMTSVAEVEEALDYFYNLTWVEMCGCGIPSEEMDALWKRHPETRFVWTVRVGACTLRTDVTTFMPYQFGYDGFRKLYDRDTKELKYCVDIMCMDMGHMGITDYSFLEYMPKMKYLVLADTDGTDFSALANLKELVFLELFMTRFNQAEVLTGLTALEDLNLGHSGIKNIEPLKEMTWLKRLWMPGTVYTYPQKRQELVDALTDTWVVFAAKGSTDGGWRQSPNYYAMRDLLNMGYMN